MKFDLTDQQVQVIAEALGNAPFRTSAPVINELQRQITEQQNATKLPDQPQEST